MFIIIPCILILASLAGMTIIVRRKLPYLRKLSPEAHEVGDNMVYDFFPELMEWFHNIPWHEYKQSSLREIEKGLRRMRLAFLKIDHASARLIQKVRHQHLTTELEQTLSELGQVPSPVEDKPEPITISPMEAMKAREQQLIIDIAQDPKNPELYETLGDLYIEMGNTQDAKEAYEAGLGFAPDNVSLAHKYSALLKKDSVS